MTQHRIEEPGLPGPWDDEDLIAPAWISPWAAVVLVRDFPQAVRYLQSKGQSLAMTGKLAAGRELMLSAASIRRKAIECAPQLDVGAAVGNSALPSEGGGASSESPPGGAGLTAGVVAEMLELKVRQVRNMCQPGGRLSATKQGGVWFVDELSVELELKRRRSARDGGS